MSTLDAIDSSLCLLHVSMRLCLSLAPVRHDSDAAERCRTCEARGHLAQCTPHSDFCCTRVSSLAKGMYVHMLHNQPQARRFSASMKLYGICRLILIARILLQPRLLTCRLTKYDHDHACRDDRGSLVSLMEVCIRCVELLVFTAHTSLRTIERHHYVRWWFAFTYI